MIPICPDYLRSRLLYRDDDTHKGNYGHLLIVAGSEPMPGAAVLATGAALRSGCGLVTLHSTARALQACVNNFPSAMLSEDSGKCIGALPENLEKYSAIAVGPGLGQSEQTVAVLSGLLRFAHDNRVPTVLDADALNIISTHPDLLECIPAGAVLTPHLGELRRFVSWESDANRDEAIRDFCTTYSCNLIFKGFHTKVFTTDGDLLVNTSGNSGMAKGGSGDVLTGLLGGLVARGYDSPTAADLAVWIHGCAGDALTAARTAEAYSSRDLIDTLDEGFRTLYLR